MLAVGWLGLVVVGFVVGWVLCLIDWLWCRWLGFGSWYVSGFAWFVDFVCCSVDCGVDAFDCCWFVLLWIGGYGCEFGVGAWGLVGD